MARVVARSLHSALCAWQPRPPRARRPAGGGCTALRRDDGCADGFVSTQLQQQIDKERSARSLLEAHIRELEKGEEAASGGVVAWLRDWLLGVG